MEEVDKLVQTYGIVKEFLEQNKVKRGWQDLILHSLELTANLEVIISQKLKEIRDEKKKIVIRPENSKILNAFSHAEPWEIKVVIIGTSPAATQSIASGLAFSADRNDQTFRPQQAIHKVHQALRKAKILEEGASYGCGHEEWARKGVLLLNAALTITKGQESAPSIETHCDIWNKFLQELLFEWIIRTPICHKLFVMRWGYAPSGDNINYAERVWSKVDKHLKLFTEVFHKDIHTFPIIHHPTFPSDKGKFVKNKFLNEAPGHFKIINDQYKNIFSLQPTDSEDDISEGTETLSLSERKSQSSK